MYSLLRTAVPSLLLLCLLVACGAREPVGPSATPTAIRVANGNAQAGTVNTALVSSISVVVTDVKGNTVSGARVDWDAAAGSGTLTPSASVSDSRGVASATWTLGTVAGNARATAQVPGVNPVIFTATVAPGAPAVVVALPEAPGLGVGDTVRVRASVRDAFGNDVTGSTMAFSSLDPDIVSVTSNGLVTAIGIGSGRIVAEATGRADTVPVSVVASGAAVCGANTPRVLALGEVLIPPVGATSVAACMRAPAVGSGEFALVMVSTAPGFATVTPLEVNAVGNTGPTTVLLTAMTSADGALDVAQASAQASNPVRDAELARRDTERRELTPLVPMAREWQAASDAMPALRAAAEAKVGDIIRLNANANVGCTRPDTRVGRVAAVGIRAIAVADTGNPSGGYTDADYASIVATFDTLVYPLDTTAFGAPSNISAYGKIVLFYTRNVNAQTPSAANYTVGGFFFARDLYPKTARGGLAGCTASNQQEMFYLLVPDPSGTINQNRRSKEQVTLLNLGTIAHEFQHLINASRRLYSTPNAVASEEAWLDEGLSHVAEELLFFRITGYTSRQNLTLTDINRQSGHFTNYASQNFSRFYTFLTSPETNSPYAPNDSLATRGAIWNFLRFSAGRQGAGGEAGFFRALVNSPTAGFTNLNNALGGQIGDYLRDWAVSTIADDYSTALTAALSSAYVLPAWNFRNIYPGLRFFGGATLGVYPIAARSLTSNVTQRIALAGGTSSYVRFSVPNGGNALLTLSSNGSAVPGSLRYAIVRLR